jgi:hypothetical protein
VPVAQTPGGTFQYRLILGSALLSTFPVVDGVAGIAKATAAGAGPWESRLG